jgi:hypothetical protein
VYTIPKSRCRLRNGAFGSFPLVICRFDFNMSGDICFRIEIVARGGSEGALNWHSASLECGTVVETIAMKFRLKTEAIG